MSGQVYGALNDGYRNLYYTDIGTLKDKVAFSEGGLKGVINRLIMGCYNVATDGRIKHEPIQSTPDRADRPGFDSCGISTDL